MFDLSFSKELHAIVLESVGDPLALEALLSQPQETIGDFDGPVALLGQEIS